MSDDGDGFDLSAALDGTAAGRVVETILGVQRERHVCPDCGVACNPTTTHDPHRAAFDGGASPTWVCPDCGDEFVRESDDAELHRGEFYDR